MEYFNRGLETYLQKTIKTRPLVYLNGPRQCGKSTMALNYKNSNYISFDSPLNLAAVKNDPASFIQSLPQKKLNILDEIQMAPEIFPYLKIKVDESRKTGENTGLFLLTGSANLMALPQLSQALVGRMSVLTLYPFSSSEYRRTENNFILDLFKNKLEYKSYKNYDILDMILNSTFPEPALNPAIDRTKWFADYLNTLLQRDIHTVADIRNPAKVIMLLSVLAMRAGGLLNNNQTAQEIGLDIKTYERYKGAAINTFIVFEIPAWAKPSNINKRFIKTAKLFFTDTNMAAYLLKRDLKDIYENDRNTMGHLFENFIATEIIKNVSALPDLEVSHFRTSDQKEVDFVLEKNGKVVGIEVKLNSSPSAHDFNGLKVLKEATGKRFKRGIVIYTGKEIVPFGEDFWAVPVCFLG